MQKRAVFVLATLFTSGLLAGTSVVSASAAGALGSLDPSLPYAEGVRRLVDERLKPGA